MVSSKALVIGVIVLVGCFLTASGLTCYKCEGNDKPPNCTQNEMCSGANTQCLSEVEKDDNGKLSYKRGCTVPASCTGKKTFCVGQKLIKNLKDCAYTCCDSNNCNDKWPSFDSGVQVTSGLVAISVAAFFALFVM